MWKRSFTRHLANMEKNNINKQVFDIIYIGSGPVLVLDALNQYLNGKNVIILDSSSKIGGAWKSLVLFDCHLVENAVHYLLNNQEGYDFLENFLDINLKYTSKKFAINLFGFKFLIKTNSLFSKFLNLIFKKVNILSFTSIFSYCKSSSFSETKYPLNGSQEIIIKLNSLIKKLQIDTKLNTKVEKIDIKNSGVLISTNKESYSSKKIVISHGFIPPEDFLINDQIIRIKKKIFRRPSLHIFYKTKIKKKIKNFSQIIFRGSKLIKYVNNLNNYQFNYQIKNDTFILVCALQHSLTNKPEIIQRVFRELEEFLIIPRSCDRSITKTFWQEVHLPMINNDDLKNLNKLSKNIITMETEELCSAIGKYSLNWIDLKKFLKKRNLKQK